VHTSITIKSDINGLRGNTAADAMRRITNAVNWYKEMIRKKRDRQRTHEPADYPTDARTDPKKMDPLVATF